MDVLGSVGAEEEVVVVDRGSPIAIVLSPERYQAWIGYRTRANERFWQTVDRIRERNAERDVDEEFDFITEVVNQVRRERRVRE